MPFMLGLAGMDIVAIILALVFAYQSLIKKRFHRRTGILSLVIAFYRCDRIRCRDFPFRRMGSTSICLLDHGDPVHPGWLVAHPPAAGLLEEHSLSDSHSSKPDISK